MKRYKKFTYMLAALLLAYLLFNFSVWNLFTRRLLNDPSCAGGDLTRLGYVSGSKMCREPVNDLPRRHIERSEYHGQPVDMITIGDSFSAGGGVGRNSYYQDYIASENGFTVLNLPEFKEIDKVSSVSLLNNSGYLDKVKPKYVLIECAEKKCLTDLPERYDFDKTMPEQKVLALPTIDFNQTAPPKSNHFNLDFFSEANYKYVRNTLLYRFSDNAYGSQVYKAKLDRPFFNVEQPDTLLFFHADIKLRKNMNAAGIAKLNDALNVLHDRLAAKGIELVFMPCVDKYNLYSGYIVKNRHPRSPFFEELRKLPKRYRFIDTKAILLEELQKGEKDVYYADDTHWSWKASEKIFKTVKFQATPH